MGLHIRIRFREPRIRYGSVVMERSDYEQLVRLLQEADQIDKELLGDHRQTAKALELLRNVKTIKLNLNNPPSPPPRTSSTKENQQLE